MQAMDLRSLDRTARTFVAVPAQLIPTLTLSFCGMVTQIRNFPNGFARKDNKKMKRIPKQRRLAGMLQILQAQRVSLTSQIRL